MMSSIQQRFSPRFQRWLNRRIPPSNRVTLDQRRIFIVPTRAGLAWLILSLIIFLVAANYSNNLAYGLTFFMISLFLLSILHTWKNLAGLTLSSGQNEPVFMGQDAEVTLELKSDKRERVAIELGWPGNEQRLVSFLDSQKLQLQVRADRRGCFSPGRLKVQSVFPLGLCRAWSWIDLDVRVLVYPNPDLSCPLPLTRTEGEEASVPSFSGQDDFAGFRRYQNVDLPAHVDWKGFARSRELNTKLFEENAGGELLLKLDRTPGQSLEARLSVLTGWCLLCEQERQPYALSLSGRMIATGLGSAHRHSCLEALALYESGLKREKS